MLNIHSSLIINWTLSVLQETCTYVTKNHEAFIQKCLISEDSLDISHADEYRYGKKKKRLVS